MLLPTVLIIAVNLALGFVAAVGRERILALRAGLATNDVAPATSAETPPETSPETPPAATEDSATSEETPNSAPVEPTHTPDAAEAENVPAAAETDGPAPSPDDASAEPAASTDQDAAVQGNTDQVNADQNAASQPDDVDSATDDEPLSDDPSLFADDARPAASAPQAESAVAPADSNHAVKPDAGDRDVADDDVPHTVAVDAATNNASADVPEQWFDLLSDIEKEGYGKCQSFVEASTQVLRLEVGRYRGELVQLDVRIRKIFASFDAEALAAALVDLEAVNNDWLARQGEAVGHLVSRRGNLGELQSTGQRLEEVLLDQTAQIESSCSNIRQLDFQADRAAAQRRLLVEMCRLIDMAHALRDQLQAALLAIITSENRVATLDRRLHVDPLCGFINRTGLEAVFHEWWRDDPNRIRQLTLAMFDVVRVGRFNERHGAAVGDGLLEAVGKLLDGALRKKRGCDQAARYSGQRFVVMLGDTGPRNATSAAERIRQMIAASTFEVDGEPVEVHVSCGVAEVLQKDDSTAVLQRLEAAVALAKKSGRNVTCLDEGRGPALVEDPPHYEVKGKIVRLAAC